MGRDGAIKQNIFFPYLRKHATEYAFVETIGSINHRNSHHSPCRLSYCFSHLLLLQLCETEK